MRKAYEAHLYRIPDFSRKQRVHASQTPILSIKNALEPLLVSKCDVILRGSIQDSIYVLLSYKTDWISIRIMRIKRDLHPMLSRYRTRLRKSRRSRYPSSPSPQCIFWLSGMNFRERIQGKKFTYLTNRLPLRHVRHSFILIIDEPTGLFFATCPKDNAVPVLSRVSIRFVFMYRTTHLKILTVANNPHNEWCVLGDDQNRDDSKFGLVPYLDSFRNHSRFGH